ncbi:MAG: class II aldolase/adducin family protein [Candidatus Acidiferrales bacterium]
MIHEMPIAVGASARVQDEVQSRREICRIGKWLYRREFVVAAEGNLSVRLGADRILVTPSGACKGRLLPDDLVITDLDGTVVCGTGEPSSEIQMHLLYYRSRPDVQSVCHAHPATATGFAAAGRALEEAVLPEVVSVLGKIPLAPYGTPGTWELCAGIEPLVAKHDAILLENHGVVTAGADLVTAFHHMETVEHFARVMLAAESLGGPRLLTQAEVRKLSAVSRGARRLVSRRQNKVISAANGRNRFNVPQPKFKPYSVGSGTSPLKRSQGNLLNPSPRE